LVTSACRLLLRPSNHTHLAITPYEGAYTKRVGPLEAVADQWRPTLSQGRALRSVLCLILRVCFCALRYRSSCFYIIVVLYSDVFHLLLSNPEKRSSLITPRSCGELGQRSKCQVSKPSTVIIFSKIQLNPTIMFICQSQFALHHCPKSHSCINFGFRSSSISRAIIGRLILEYPVVAHSQKDKNPRFRTLLHLQ
jgi:hypothetical protein